MSNTLEELTPQQIADLRDIAVRYRGRRERQAKAGAAVQRNAWTWKQAKLNGLLNSKQTLVWALSVEGRNAGLEHKLGEVLDEIAQLQAGGVTL